MRMEQGKSIELSQWEAYELEKMNVEPQRAFESLLLFMSNNVEQINHKNSNSDCSTI